MRRRYPPRTVLHAALFVKPSGIQGRGVHAREPIARGQIVMTFGGRRISRRQMEAGGYRMASVWPVGRDTFIALPTSDRRPSLDEYLNHSCDASTWLTDEVTLVARRDIEAGEEITLDQATWNSDDAYLDDGESCSCGARACRRVLTPGDWMRADVQRRYAGHFHPVVRALVARARRAASRGGRPARRRGPKA